MQLPAPLRAAVGLVATAAENVKRLPDRAIELPMLAVSTALQASLRAQQRYAELAARGDEVLGRGASAPADTDEPPAWATFDEPVPTEALIRTTEQQEREVAIRHETPAEAPAPEESEGDLAAPPARRATSSARKSTATRSASSTRSSTRSAARSSSRSSSTASSTASAGKSTAKKVTAPRHQPPSAFDRVEDE